MLLAQFTEFFKAPKILEDKLESELTSGTSCGQYVLRCIGLSVITYADKGDMLPDDVYKAITKLKCPNLTVIYYSCITPVILKEKSRKELKWWFRI